MTNDDKSQQPANSDNLVLAAIRSLEAGMAGIEEIIVARLNTTRPFDHQLLAKINDLVDKQTTMQQDLVTIRQEQAAMRQEQVAIRAEIAGFRAETNSNFRVVNKKLGLLSNDFLHIRAEQDLLDQRVTQLEEKVAA